MRKTIAILAGALAAILLVPAPARAQAAAPQPLFSCSTAAVGLRLGGQTAAGTDAACQFNLTKNNVLESDNFLVPGLSFEGYYGTYRRNFDLAALVKKTNIPADTFQPHCDVSGGVVRYAPATGATVQNLSAMAGCGFDYDPLRTAKFSIGPMARYVYAPGFGGSPHGVEFSADLTFVLGRK